VTTERPPRRSRAEPCPPRAFHGFAAGRETKLAKDEADDKQRSYPDALADDRDGDRPIDHLFEHPVTGGLHDHQHAGEYCYRGKKPLHADHF
jgi:hypothetical protein